MENELSICFEANVESTMPTCTPSFLSCPASVQISCPWKIYSLSGRPRTWTTRHMPPSVTNISVERASTSIVRHPHLLFPIQNLRTRRKQGIAVGSAHFARNLLGSLTRRERWQTYPVNTPCNRLATHRTPHSTTTFLSYEFSNLSSTLSLAARVHAIRLRATVVPSSLGERFIRRLPILTFHLKSHSS